MQTAYDKSANGLRGLAAVNVALLHFIGAFVPSLVAYRRPVLFAQNDLEGMLLSLFQLPLFSLLYNGYLAVMIFFVLSGYVLAMPAFHHQSAPLKSRLLGRYPRLSIPIAISIAVSYALYRSNLYFNIPAGNALGSEWLKGFFSPGIPASLAGSSALYGTVLFGNEALNPPLWTLRPEFIGSLLLLIFYLWVPKSKILFGTLAVSIMLFAFYRTESLYFIALFLGALLNKVRLGKKAVIACVVAGLYLGSFQYRSPFFDFLPHLQYGTTPIWPRRSFYNTLAALMLVAAVANGFGRAFLESAFVQFLGNISFSFYLYHFIVLCSFSSALYLTLPPAPGMILVHFCAYFTLCFLVAFVATRWVDRPAIDLSRRFAKSVMSE